MEDVAPQFDKELSAQQRRAGVAQQNQRAALGDKIKVIPCDSCGVPLLVQLQVVEEQLGTQRTRLRLSTQPAASLSSKRKRGHPKHEGQVIRNEIKRLEQLMVKLRSRKTSCLSRVPADVADEYQSGAMVGCDGRCAGWYHPQCIGYTKRMQLRFCCRCFHSVVMSARRWNSIVKNLMQ